MNYTVIEEHRINYPNPITIEKGTKLRIGDKYSGPEDWENWIYCYTLDDDTQGWVPEQLIDIDNGYGTILEDYTAKELNVNKGEVVRELKETNGWIWCVRIKDGDEGWLPKEKLILC